MALSFLLVFVCGLLLGVGAVAVGLFLYLTQENNRTLGAILCGIGALLTLGIIGAFYSLTVLM